MSTDVSDLPEPYKMWLPNLDWMLTITVLTPCVATKPL